MRADNCVVEPATRASRSTMEGHLARVFTIGHQLKLLNTFGGASRARTDDLIVANDALSQLSYSPTRVENKGSACGHEARSRPHYTKNAGRMKCATSYDTRDRLRSMAAQSFLQSSLVDRQ